MPNNTSFLNDLLSTIADRGRTLLDLTRSQPLDGAGVVDLCEALLSGRGEASGVALAKQILDAYADLDGDEKSSFFAALLDRFSPDFDRLADAIAAYQADPGSASARQLHDATEARRLELIRRLNLAPGGTAALVAMRVDLIDRLRDAPELAPVDEDFVHLFTSWFNRGFLVMQRIDWSTPAVILERIIRYEAVHEISDWDDLRRRIDPPDRRCFAFFHPSLVDDPLIFVEVALTEDIPGAIVPILAEDRDVLDLGKAATAVFYSISNCQRGLRGISFGNFLIKQVAEELQRELSGIRTFVTLSPIPGFRRWLDAVLEDSGDGLVSAADRKVLTLIERKTWATKSGAVKRLEPLVKSLGAHYLVRVKANDGRPANSVARFHLGNGARLERLNWLADTSDKGLSESAGLMVNYRYVLKDIERNHEAFANAGEVVASSAVRNLLPTSRVAEAEPAG